MLFLLRLLLIGGVLAGLGYAGLYALVTLIEPEPREITISIDPPRVRPAP